MTDIVIPLGAGSFWENEELRYCLRSIHRYLKGYGDIYIIGKCPEFLKGVKEIPCDDMSPHDKEFNIWAKIMKACSQDMSSELLFFNDDHFLLREFDAETFPFFYSQGLEDIIRKRNAMDSYKESLINTFFELYNNQRPTRYFDVHTPIRYTRSMFPLATNVKWAAYPSFVIKSLYANNLFIHGEEYEDVKIESAPDDYEDFVKDKIMFSTGGGRGAKEKMIKFLEYLYPERSPWEVT